MNPTTHGPRDLGVGRCKTCFPLLTFLFLLSFNWEHSPGSAPNVWVPLYSPGRAQSFSWFQRLPCARDFLPFSQTPKPYLCLPLDVAPSPLTQYVKHRSSRPHLAVLLEKLLLVWLLGFVILEPLSPTGMAAERPKSLQHVSSSLSPSHSPNYHLCITSRKSSFDLTLLSWFTSLLKLSYTRSNYSVVRGYHNQTPSYRNLCSTTT